jgi:hypothetical protein
LLNQQENPTLKDANEPITMSRSPEEQAQIAQINLLLRTQHTRHRSQHMTLSRTRQTVFGSSQEKDWVEYPAIIIKTLEDLINLADTEDIPLLEIQNLVFNFSFFSIIRNPLYLNEDITNIHKRHIIREKERQREVLNRDKKYIENELTLFVQQHKVTENEMLELKRERDEIDDDLGTLEQEISSITSFVFPEHTPDLEPFIRIIKSSNQECLIKTYKKQKTSEKPYDPPALAQLFETDLSAYAEEIYVHFQTIPGIKQYTLDAFIRARKLILDALSMATWHSEFGLPGRRGQ